MRRSYIADDIEQERLRAEYFKRIAARKKKLNFKCKVDDKMQCDKCSLRYNCEDVEDI